MKSWRCNTSKLLYSLPLWLTALWWGSLTTVGFLVVPLLFVHLPTPAMAGGMAAKLFTAQTTVSAVCAGVDVVTELLGDRGVLRQSLALGKLPAQGFEVWVTHQVNISALTGVSPGMGEAVVVRLAGGKVHNLARIRFED